MPSRAAVFALFYFSGIAGLIYQTLWLRRLSAVFGVTVYAASTVLAAFMAGLALGAALSERVLRRRIAPLAAFGIAELLIGVTGLLSPFLIDAASFLYAALHDVAPDSLSLLTMARLVSSFAILALPTTMMGITLPLLTAAVARERDSAATSVSWLYALNTLGAMTGTLLAGYILVPAIGIANAFMLAAATNVAVGVSALMMSRSGSSPSSEPDSEFDLRSPYRDLRLLSVVVLVSGFASLALEIVWFRLMLQFVAATTEAFTAMLTTVLGGIAIGGMIAALVLRRARDRAFALGLVQALTGVAAVASLWFLLWTVQQGWKTMGLWQAVVIAILPPALFMGVGFPLALGMSSAGAETGDAGYRRRQALRVARLYSLNVAGAIAGSLAGGFLLLPRAGSLNTLIALGALLLASGLMVLIVHRSPGRIAAAVALLAAFVVIARDVPDPFKVAIDRRYGSELLEFWRDEGPQTAVSVRASRYQRVLYLDGLHQANDQPEMVRLHRALGHLPMVLHGSPSEVLVVGMGGGATPGAVSQHAGAQVLIVELSDSVRQAAPLFKHVNYDLLNQPNVRVRIDDGRNFLALSKRSFDVITADIIQPGHAGAGFVYSREYFSLVRDALTDNGVALQWIGHRPSVEYKLIMRTFLDVFPHATLWYDANFMIGTKRPLRLDRGVVDRLRANPVTAAALADVGLLSWAELRSWYTGGPEEMRAFVGAGPILTDDRPLVEYHHFLPRPEQQPPLDLASLKGDVMRHVH